MRWIRIMLALMWLLAAAGESMAQAVDALAYETIQPSRIKLGESATIRVTGFSRLKDIELPSIPGLVFENLGRSQGFDIVNGTPIPATFILIRVTPQFTGVFTIPAFTPNSRSIGLEVVTADAPNPYTWRSQTPAPPPARVVALPKGVQLQAGGGAFVHLVLPSRAIYVGERVPVQIDVGLRPGVVTAVNGLPTLEGSGFTFDNLSKEPERREEAIEGGSFVVLTWRSALAAVKPGDFSLSAQAPVTVKISTLSAADRAITARLASPLLLSLYNGIAPKEMTIASSPSRVKVLPLPEAGKPDDFSGAVGEFHVSSDISPASVAVGEPLTLRLHVRGTGNFDRVDATMFDHLEHWKTYPAKSSFTEGDKTFEQPLIASQPGEQSIPGLQFSFFNPGTRRYERVQTPATIVTVAATAIGGLSRLARSGAIPGLRPDHSSRQGFVADLRPLYFQLPFLTIPATLALLLAGGWLAVHPRPAGVNARATAHAIAQLDATAQAGDVSGFLEAARLTLLQTFAARWQMRADQVTLPELKARLGVMGEEVERLFALADEARYADHQPGAIDFQRWLQLIRSQLAAEDE
jgi:hypothetical protein